MQLLVAAHAACDDDDSAISPEVGAGEEATAKAAEDADRKESERLAELLSTAEARVEAAIAEGDRRTSILQTDLDRERDRTRRLQSDLVARGQELVYAREKTELLKNEMEKRVAAAEEETQRLKRRLSAKAITSASQEEMEYQLKQMTECTYSCSRQLGLADPSIGRSASAQAGGVG